ncbi:MAG: hypothetical protein ACK4NC_04670 [Candidatus Gracilibacteria bacterium]
MQSQGQPIAQSTGATAVAAPIDPRIQELHALQAITSPIIATTYPDVVQMLFETPSLTFQEKQYWLRLLPLMTLEQVDKLRDILTTERKKLIEIQQQYAVAPPQTFGDTQRINYEAQRTKKEMLKKQEHVAQRVEEEHEEALLDQLDEIG